MKDLVMSSGYGTSMKEKRLWITWVFSRRSQVLSRVANADFLCFGWDIRGIKTKLKYLFISPIKYSFLSLKTILILLKERPSIVFVQNAPIFLAFTALFYKILCGAKLVIDTHGKSLRGFWVRNPIKSIVKYTIRKADLNIISNEEQIKILKEWNVKPIVLPDKIPEFEDLEIKELKGRDNIVVINSFSSDESISEVVEAAKKVKDVYFYITGNIKYAKEEYLKNKPENIIFTDFLPEKEYLRLLWSSDAVMTLTKREGSLLCGCFEALAVEKPLITSDTKTLRKFFKIGTMFTENTSEKIAETVKNTIKNKERLREEIKMLKKQKTKEWWDKWKEVMIILN